MPHEVIIFTNFITIRRKLWIFYECPISECVQFLCSDITTHTRNSAELEFGVTGVDHPNYITLGLTHTPKGVPTPKQGFGIDPRLDAVTIRVPAASSEDYRPQVILKFQFQHS